jgi:hypothetical protein
VPGPETRSSALEGEMSGYIPAHSLRGVQ